LLAVYFSLIYSNVQYCITSLGSAPTTTLKPLTMIQKCAVRMIARKLYYLTSTTPFFLQLKLLKLNDIYKLQMAKLMHRMHNETLFGQQHLKKLKQVYKHNTRLSAKSNYYHCLIRTNLGKRLFSYSRPQDIKSASKFTFKKQLYQHLLKQYS